MTTGRLGFIASSLGAVILLATAWQSVAVTRPGVRRGLYASEAFIDSTKDSRFSGSLKMVLAPYELTNDGDVPIRIIKVESSCNCSAPKVEPWTVEPGGKAIVYTETKRPPLGERVVSFTIHTDSQVSPTLNLHLKVASDRKPPYLSGVRGDANFQGSPGVGDRSEIVVYTLSEREVDREPKVLVHPAGLGLACTLIGSNASRADGLQIWQHEYQYKLEFDKAPPPGISTGEIVVEDPWDPKHLERLPVYINNKNGLQLFPSTVSLARADRWCPTMIARPDG